MRPRSVGLALALSLSVSACESKPEAPPPPEQPDPFAETVDRAKVTTAPALGDPPPLRLKVRTTALDLELEQREWRGISRTETHGLLTELGNALVEAKGETSAPVLALDIEASVEMGMLQSVIRAADWAGIEEFVAIVQTSTGPARIAWRYGPPTPSVGPLASPNFGLTASFTSDGAFMTLGSTGYGVPAALANPNGTCPTAPATDGVLDPALVVERIHELPPEARGALAFGFAEDLTWSQAAPILAAIAASGIELNPSRMVISTDCDEPFLAADYQPPKPEVDPDPDAPLEPAEPVVVDGVSLSEPSLHEDGLPPYIVRRIIKAHRGELADCRRKARDVDPAARGTLEVVAQIDAKGKIEWAKAVSPELSTKTIACVEKAFERWTFPKPSDGVAVGFEVEIQFE